MTIKARLLGHDFDLADLVEIFETGEPCVGKDQDGYYLTSAELEAVSGDVGQMQRVGRQLVERINGVGWMLRTTFQPVELADHFEEDAGSGVQHHQVLSADVSARSRISASVLVVGEDGSTSPLPAPKTKSVDYVALSKTHTEVAEVLKLLGASADPLGWVELYKVYEVVRDHAGGDKGMQGEGWTTRAEISAFTGSANRPDVSGDGARHARATGDTPPKRTMGLSEGQAFIRKLARVWMDSLA